MINDLKTQEDQSAFSASLLALAVIVLLVAFSESSFAASASDFFKPAQPGQVVVDDQMDMDSWVIAAQLATPEELQGRGDIQCRYQFQTNAYGSDLEYMGKGETNLLARRSLHLQCIRHRCGEVGQWIMGSFEQNKNVSDDDYAVLMKAQGYSAEEIAEKLALRRQEAYKKLASQTCLDTSPLGRTVVVTTCLTQPVEAHCYDKAGKRHKSKR